MKVELSLDGFVGRGFFLPGPVALVTTVSVAGTLNVVVRELFG